MTTYRDIPGFPGYRAGDDGTIWSCWKVSSRGRAGLQPRVMGTVWHELKPRVDDRRRKTVKLCRDGRVLHKLVPRLVLEAHVGPCPAGNEACHFPDRDPSNNALSNLRWDTKQANRADMVHHGTDPREDRNGRAKLTRGQVIEIRHLFATGTTRKAIVQRFPQVGRTAIDWVLNGGTWKKVLA